MYVYNISNDNDDNNNGIKEHENTYLKLAYDEYVISTIKHDVDLT